MLLADGAQIRQHLPLGDLLSQRRQTLRAGLDAAGLGRLDAPAGIRVGDDLAVEFDGRRQFADRCDHMAQAELALHRLGHEQAAVGKPLLLARL
jgi:hypothetical protein